MQKNITVRKGKQEAIDIVEVAFLFLHNRRRTITLAGGTKKTRTALISKMVAVGIIRKNCH